jgi:hypothetical protein
VCGEKSVECNGLGSPKFVVEKLMDVKKPRVSQILEGAARTYEERGALYGDNYKLFGKIMMAMFPDGLVLNSEDDFNRFNMFTQCSGKLTRYAQMFSRGGHLDSAHDEIVYAAMLQELTELTQEVNAQKAKSHE